LISFFSTAQQRVQNRIVTMAQVLLLCVAQDDNGNDYNRGAFLKLKRSAAAGGSKNHFLVDDPDSADVILFAELKGAGPYFELVRRHPFVKHYREKCFLFCANAFVIPFLPGVYACIEKRWRSRRTIPGFYLGVSENKFVRFTPPAEEQPYLYSFVGSLRNAPVRRLLAELRHPRSLIQDTSADYDRVLYGRVQPDELLNFWRRYAEVMEASKFVLCPRGLGASSVRLFDTMRMGRVPVILSDDWIEPPGPCWKRFSVRIQERDYAQIPALLEAREGDALSMGKLARQQWEEWFSDEVCFHRVVDACLRIQSQRRIPEKWLRFIPFLQFLRPFHFRHLLRTKFQALEARMISNRGPEHLARPISPRAF
jgi:hypothetical protein